MQGVSAESSAQLSSAHKLTLSSLPRILPLPEGAPAATRTMLASRTSCLPLLAFSTCSLTMSPSRSALLHLCPSFHFRPCLVRARWKFLATSRSCAPPQDGHRARAVTTWCLGFGFRVLGHSLRRVAGVPWPTAGHAALVGHTVCCLGPCHKLGTHRPGNLECRCHQAACASAAVQRLLVMTRADEAAGSRTCLRQQHAARPGTILPAQQTYCHICHNPRPWGQQGSKPAPSQCARTLAAPRHFAGASLGKCVLTMVLTMSGRYSTTVTSEPKRAQTEAISRPM